MLCSSRLCRFVSFPFETSRTMKKEEEEEEEGRRNRIEKRIISKSSKSERFVRFQRDSSCAPNYTSRSLGQLPPQSFINLRNPFPFHFHCLSPSPSLSLSFSLSLSIPTRVGRLPPLSPPPPLGRGIYLK